MSFTEQTKVGDNVQVALVRVRREPPPDPVPPPEPDGPGPTADAQKATVEQTGADPPPWVLRANYEALAARLHRVEDWIDVVSSPLYKRLWFVLIGYRWKRLGRRCDPPWPPASPGWWRG